MNLVYLRVIVGLSLWISSSICSSNGFASSPGIDYRDVAEEWGIQFTGTYGSKGRNDYILETTGFGVAVVDIDGDGDNDIVALNGTTFELARKGLIPPYGVFLNEGQGKFRNVAESSGLRNQGWSQAICAGDYDNDGLTDLVITGYGFVSVYRNEGGRFREVSREVGLEHGSNRWASGCAFLDYDRDGDLDLFVSNYVELDLARTPKPGQGEFCRWKGIPVMCGPRGLPRSQNALYRNEGGRFVDVSAETGILVEGGRYGLGVGVADFDADGWPDIYVACDMTPSLLYHNLGNGKFEEIGLVAGVALNYDGHLQAGMGVAIGDYDNDGLLDIAKTNFSGDYPSLYHNEGQLLFTDVAPWAGVGLHQLLGWGVAFVDVDEDGWSDLLMANGHVYPEVDHADIGETYAQLTLLYRNRGDGQFEDWTGKAGPALRVKRPARGLAVGDLDGDGHPEVVITNVNAPLAVLRNFGARQNAVVVKLEGVQSNRSEIGAKIVVQVGGIKQTRVVTSGGSYYSQHALEQYFGVGKSTKVDLLEVWWPSGLKQSWSDLPVNFRYRLREGQQKFLQEPLEGRQRH